MVKNADNSDCAGDSGSFSDVGSLMPLCSALRARSIICLLRFLLRLPFDG